MTIEETTYALEVILDCGYEGNDDLQKEAILNAIHNLREHNALMEKIDLFCRDIKSKGSAKIAIEQITTAFINQEEFYFGCYKADDFSCKEVHCFSCMESFLKKACGAE